MADTITLTRYRNIKLMRREAGDVLTVGVDIDLGQAQTLVRIGGAVWDKKRSKKNPAKSNKSSQPAVENK